mmetsp:Transcript_26556/g.71733  ORF Transcript_26556/g.71733 Transcript_26556/m.71733 type:complete len:291 (-) Transcript_26556:331-1203(-)
MIYLFAAHEEISLFHSDRADHVIDGSWRAGVPHAHMAVRVTRRTGGDPRRSRRCDVCQSLCETRTVSSLSPPCERCSCRTTWTARPTGHRSHAKARGHDIGHGGRRSAQCAPRGPRGLSALRPTRLRPVRAAPRARTVQARESSRAKCLGLLEHFSLVRTTTCRGAGTVAPSSALCSVRHCRKLRGEHHIGCRTPHWVPDTTLGARCTGGASPAQRGPHPDPASTRPAHTSQAQTSSSSAARSVPMAKARLPPERRGLPWVEVGSGLVRPGARTGHQALCPHNQPVVRSP